MLLTFDHSHSTVNAAENQSSLKLRLLQVTNMRDAEHHILGQNLTFGWLQRV